MDRQQQWMNCYMVVIILKTLLNSFTVVASNSYRCVIHYQKRLEGRKNKIHFFFKPSVQSVRYRSLFANNLSKKFIAKKLYYYDYKIEK